MSYILYSHAVAWQKLFLRPVPQPESGFGSGRGRGARLDAYIYMSDEFDVIITNN